VIEGLLFDGIHVDCTGVAKDHGIQPAAPVFSHPAGASLAVGNDAAMRTEMALDIVACMRDVAVGNG
jgi:hypothetical protein